jgi:2-desacetyl-2-hydroxyethyl bacteriochlorophyllide A dehydrogenase
MNKDTKLMKAVVIDAFGDEKVLQIREVRKPNISAGQILLKIRSSCINPIDWKMRQGHMTARYGSEFPMILGWDCSGTVAELGKDVSNFAIGDEVFARSDVGTGGCYAEYSAINITTAIHKPPSLSHAEASSIPLVGLTAINGLIKCANLQSDQRVLIVGASGGVGTLAIQIAKNIGAHVTGVCSTNNVDLVKSLGADVVIDYNEQDATKYGPYDVFYDTVGVYTYEKAKPAITTQGLYLTLVPGPGIDFFTSEQSTKEPGKGYFVTWKPTSKDLQILADWAEAGKIKAVIDSSYPLADIQTAHLHSQTERAVGKIVINISGH